MAGSDEERTVTEGTGDVTKATDWRRESRFYRGKPGVGWLFAVVAVPALLALIGWGGLDREAAESDELTLPTVNPTATLSATAGVPAPSTAQAAEGDFAPWSIVRSGNEFRIAGELPDEQTKKGLLDSLNLVLPGATVTDGLTVKPGVRTPDIAGLGGVFSAAVGIPDFNLTLDGDTLTLTGSAPAEAVRASAETYARTAFPNVNVVNEIEVTGAGETGASPTPASPASPTPASPGSPSPTVSPAPTAGAPAPAPAEGCGALQADITALLRTPITFRTDGFTVSPESARVLAAIADKVEACPNARLAVVGYTDNTGNDAINVPLSGNRAKAVADALVSGGVPAASVSSSGEGAADPVADNGTAEGRAQNRRVEITVS